MASSSPQPSARASLSRVRGCVLVIEDNDELRDVLGEVLVSGGYRVRSYPAAAEALRELQNDEPPDLIVFDLVMPGMNGWEFRVEQRKRPNLANIPVIALSGDSSAQAMAIDADAYLRKPVDDRDLLDTVERLLVSLERERLQARSAELERLTSLGLLAAGIAHEVNNPLTFVVGNLELALRKCQALEASASAELRTELRELSELVSYAERGAERISSVVRSVSTFSRPDDLRSVALDVREVLDSVLRLVSNEMRHRAQLVREYQDPPLVTANPAKLGQIFLNLLINALGAIGEASTAREHVIHVAARRARNGNAVVAISDTGRGIPRELVGRIFEPFFSTKPTGTGLGLGLTISQRLLAAMGGSISVESEPGKGTTFRVELPPAIPTSSDVPGDGARAAAQANPSARSQSGIYAQPRHRRARVLVIDDEPMMCDLLKAMLEDEYEVEAFTNPHAALSKLQAGESYDVILSDVMMPELSGMDVFDVLFRERPDQAARMLFMTGGTFTERGSAFLDRLGQGLLKKPFSQHEVRRLIRERLEAPTLRAYAN